MTSRARAIAAATARLAAAGIPDPERDARILCRWAARLSAAGLSAALTDTPPQDEHARFEAAIALRETRKPVSQIIGTRAFWGRQFQVTPDVLDPRPETETLVAAALSAPARRILDLGTGSGCILLTLLAEWPGATGLGVDCSAAALAVAERNAASFGLSRRAAFAEGNWCAPVRGRFDLIAANPPYISEEDWHGLAPDVRLHEPRIALTPGGDGLDAYRRIAAETPPHLSPGGRLVLEIGPDQGAAVMALLTAAGFHPAPPIRDFDRRDRVIVAQFTNFS